MHTITTLTSYVIVCDITVKISITHQSCDVVSDAVKRAVKRTTERSLLFVELEATT